MRQTNKKKLSLSQVQSTTEESFFAKAQKHEPFLQIKAEPVKKIKKKKWFHNFWGHENFNEVIFISCLSKLWLARIEKIICLSYVCQKIGGDETGSVGPISI